MTARTWIGSAAAAGAALALMTTTQAGLARPGDAVAVTAVSRYGNGSLTAPIRPARFGHEVRLPGGVWIHCAGDCRETLRRQKLDFWETLQEERGGGDDWR